MPTVMCYNSISRVPFTLCVEIINMPNKRLSLDTDNVIKLYLSNHTPQFIADKHKCSVHAVQNCLRREGVYTGNDWRGYIKRKFNVTPEELVSMYNSGMWKSEIAAKTGISEGAIGRYLSELGIPLANNRSEAMSQRLIRLGANGRSKLTEAAHNAVRGMRRTIHDLTRRAAGREKSGKTGSITEDAFFDMLTKSNFSCVPQKAVGKYNIDFTIANLAVS